jgi:hypothetical protein
MTMEMQEPKRKCPKDVPRHLQHNGRGKPTASSLSADGFPLMAGPNFQPLDGNPTVISILRQLADGPKNVPEM